MNIYIDESIHPHYKFIVTALVVTQTDVSPLVEDALRAAGLQPGKDEFKSGARMEGNESLWELRDALLGVVSFNSKLAFYISNPSHRNELGAGILSTIELLAKKNGLNLSDSNVYLDEGIFRSVDDANRTFGGFECLAGVNFNPEQDSKKIAGIQLADLVANSMSQTLRETVTGCEKIVNIGGPDTGYHEDETAPLGWELLMNVRYNFFTRNIVFEGETFDRDTNPYVLGPDEDQVDYGMHPEILGWSIFLSDNIADRVRQAVSDRLGKIWLGCIH